jgi:hypothetical protein
MESIITTGAVLSAVYTGYKTSRKLMKDLSKWRHSALHKPRRFKKKITGLILPVGMLNDSVKQQLATIHSIQVIDVDGLVNGIQEFERKVMVVKNELKNVMDVYGKHKHYILMGSDPLLIKLCGSQSRYVGMLDETLYNSIRGKTDISDTDQLALVDNIVKIQKQTATISKHRKFLFKNETELIETLLFLYSK